MPTDNTWLAATTLEDVTSELELIAGEVVQVSARGLGVRESIPVEIYQGDGYYPLHMGTAVELTARNNTIVLCGPGQYRFNKPATASVVALYKDV
jgi:hypothetical protein